MKKFRIDEITINLDNLRKPLNSQQRKEMSKKKLYPYYGANNLMDYIDEYIFDEEILCVAEDGGSWGYKEKCSYIVNEKCWVNNHAHILKAKENLNLKYLMYYLNYNDLTNKITGTTRGKLTKSALNSIEIKLPLIEEQNKIVILLEKAQALIHKRKKQIEELDLLVKSKFIEMFGNPIINSKGWDIKLLGEVCEMKAGKSIKSAYIYENNNGKLYPCYGGNGLRGYVKDYSHDGNIPLIGRQGALCGNVKYVQGKFYATEHAVVTNPKIKMNTYWLYYILQQLDLNRLSTGAAQPGLTISKLNDVELPIAPIGMQKDFENFAKQVDKLKFIKINK